MKRQIGVLLAVLLLFSLAACSRANPPEETLPPVTADPGGADEPAAGTEDPAGAATETVGEYQYFFENFDDIVRDPSAHYDDYNTFYELLLLMHGHGDVPYTDRLVAEGEVTDAFSLTIDGKTFSNEEAGALTVYTAAFRVFTKVEGHDFTFVGYRFTEVCELLGVTLDGTIKLNATDGYSQGFDTKNIDDNTMIAILRDGDAADGPYFAPCSMIVNSNYTKYLSDITR